MNLVRRECHGLPADRACDADELLEPVHDSLGSAGGIDAEVLSNHRRKVLESHRLMQAPQRLAQGRNAVPLEGCDALQDDGSHALHFQGLLRLGQGLLRGDGGGGGGGLLMNQVLHPLPQGISARDLLAAQGQYFVLPFGEFAGED